MIIVSNCFGCMQTAMPDGSKGPIAVQPTNAPSRTITNFTEALRCMDNLFVAYSKTGFIITSTSVPDATGKLQSGVRDMLITALSLMSQKSQAFTYVDYEKELVKQDTVQTITDLLDKNNLLRLQAPQVYIRGSISQLDNAIETGNKGAGGDARIGSVGLGGGYNQFQTYSLISLDLHLGNFTGRQLIPGMVSHNQVAVVKGGKGYDFSANIAKLGVNFNVDSQTSEGSHQAVRTLVELGALELMGKWTRVPYWQCLQIERTSPGVMAEVRGWFDGMDEAGRRAAIRAGLNAAGYPAADMSDAALGRQIGAFQVDHGLVVSGRPTFETYLALMSIDDATLRKNRDDHKAASGSPPTFAGGVDAVVTLQAPRPLEVSLSTNRGRVQRWLSGERVNIILLVSRSSYVQCYYADSVGVISQIYPNRFQRETYVAGNRSLTVPDPTNSESFRIELSPGRTADEFLCAADEAPFQGRLPPQLAAEDLTPLQVSSLDDIEAVLSALPSVRPIGTARLKLLR